MLRHRCETRSESGQAQFQLQSKCDSYIQVRSNMAQSCLTFTLDHLLTILIFPVFEFTHPAQPLAIHIRESTMLESEPHGQASGRANRPRE